MKNDLPGEGQENQPLAHSSVSDYLASKTVYGSLFGDSLPPHPVPGEYGILLRRLWHQRLGELQKLECLYTAPLFRQAVACPGYLLGDYDSDVSSASCKSAYLAQADIHILIHTVFRNNGNGHRRRIVVEKKLLSCTQILIKRMSLLIQPWIKRRVGNAAVIRRVRLMREKPRSCNRAYSHHESQ